MKPPGAPRQTTPTPDGVAAARAGHAAVEASFPVAAMSAETPAIEWFEGSRDELADLFALADDSPAALSAYRDLGRVLVARDGAEFGYPEIEIDGIPLRDRVWLSLSLGDAEPPGDT
jgi:hypothetical protein